MTLFLRDEHDRSIVDMEVWQTEREDGSPSMDISTAIDIKPYSHFLLMAYMDLLGNQEMNTNQTYDELFDLIKDFEDLQEMRGWLHEVYMMSDKPVTDEDFYKVLEILRERLKDIAQKYDLHYTED